VIESHRSAGSAPRHWSRTTRSPRLAGAVTLFLLAFIYALQASHRTRNIMRWWDFRFFYTIGRTWLDHQSPYRPEVFRQHWAHFFSYIQDTAAAGAFPMPWLILVLAPLALLPYIAAAWVFDVLNVAALVLCLRYTALLIFGDRSARVAWDTPRVWLAMGACCLVGGVPAAIYVGQTTLFGLAGLLGLLHYLRHPRLWLAVGCVFLTGTKPHIALLVVLYVVLTGGWLQVVIGSALTALLTVPVFVAFQPFGTLLADLRLGMAGYAAGPGNRPPRVSGLNSLLAGTPLEVSVAGWLAVAIVLTTVLAILDRMQTERLGRQAVCEQPWWIRRVAMLVVICGLLIPLKEYDSAIFLPVVALAIRSRWRRLLAFAPGLLLACRPENLARTFAWLSGGRLDLSAGHVMTLGAAYLLAVLTAQGVLDRHALRFAQSPGPDGRASASNGGGLPATSPQSADRVRGAP
jgi:hypothetical protein